VAFITLRLNDQQVFCLKFRFLLILLNLYLFYFVLTKIDHLNGLEQIKFYFLEINVLSLVGDSNLFFPGCSLGANRVVFPWSN